MEASEDDEGEVDHEGVAWNEKELGLEVDQIELIVRVAKGNSYQVKERRGGYFDLTFSVTVMPGDPGTMGAEKE